MTAVTVVVVTWQGAHLLPDCLDSLAKQTVANRVLVVDNASTDGTSELLTDRYPQVERLTLPTNTGFAGGVAAALGSVTTAYVALLNNDAAADPRWLEASLAALDARPVAAAVTAKMLLWDAGAADHAVLNNTGVRLVRGGYGADRGLGEPDGPAFDTAIEVFGFSGGAAVLRGAAVAAVGGIEASFFLYYEDTDLAWRLRLAGWQIWYEPQAIVRHRHAASTDARSDLFAFHTERNRILMLLRCAPLGFALAEIVRFMLTTASLQLRRALRHSVLDSRVFALSLRMRVVAAVLRQLPGSIRARSQIRARSSIGRRVVLNRWIER
jgi:GT2 family glycosyltransferase